MTHRRVEPDDVAPPAASYALAIETDDARRWLHTSGIVPTRPDGTVAASIADQADDVWRTIGALLREAGMGPTDVVSVTTYVVPGQDLGPVMAARDAFLDGHLAASTLLVVAELARPEWLMEIAVVAAH